MSNYFEIAVVNEFGGNILSLVFSRLLEVKDCVLYHSLGIFYRLSEEIPSVFQHSSQGSLGSLSGGLLSSLRLKLY